MQPFFRPIRGFGWFGLAGLPLVAFLLYCLLGGFDLRYSIFELIERRWGAGFIYDVIISKLLFASYWPSLTGILVSPVTLLWILIVLFLLPRRWGWWAWLSISIWMLINAPLVFYLARWGSTLPAMARDVLFLPPRLPQHISQAPSFLFLQHTLFCLLVWRILSPGRTYALRITTSVPLAIFLLGIGLGAIQYWLDLPSTQARFTIGINGWIAMGILWHTTCATLGIWAAIAVRHAARTTHHCVHCGYDIHGLTAPTCPECGNAISTDKVIAPPAPTTTAAQPGTASPT